MWQKYFKRSPLRRCVKTRPPKDTLCSNRLACRSTVHLGLVTTLDSIRGGEKREIIFHRSNQNRPPADEIANFFCNPILKNSPFACQIPLFVIRRYSSYHTFVGESKILGNATTERTQIGRSPRYCRADDKF